MRREFALLTLDDELRERHRVWPALRSLLAVTGFGHCRRSGFQRLTLAPQRGAVHWWPGIWTAIWSVISIITHDDHRIPIPADLGDLIHRLQRRDGGLSFTEMITSLARIPACAAGPSGDIVNDDPRSDGSLRPARAAGDLRPLMPICTITRPSRISLSDNFGGLTGTDCKANACGVSPSLLLSKERY